MASTKLSFTLVPRYSKMRILVWGTWRQKGAKGWNNEIKNWIDTIISFSRSWFWKPLSKCSPESCCLWHYGILTEIWMKTVFCRHSYIGRSGRYIAAKGYVNKLHLSTLLWLLLPWPGHNSFQHLCGVTVTRPISVPNVINLPTCAPSTHSARKQCRSSSSPKRKTNVRCQ